jgi:UDP-N-acetylmuramoylalanine--D-glutamate ligase
MIPVTLFKGRQVAVLGLGKSGLASAEALCAGGAEILAWDDAEAARAKARDAGIPLTDLAVSDVSAWAALILSPGIPHSYPEPHPVARQARAAGLEIIGDVELLARSRPDATYIGITGTNGKSTTTALIGHILTEAGRSVAVGGNLGTPVLSFDLPKTDETDELYVLEMSSYQLELTPSLGFDVAILLNITPDHLDRHGGMPGYVAAKRRIFGGQAEPRRGGPKVAVIGIDDAACRGIYEDLLREGGRRIIPVSCMAPVSGGVYAAGDRLFDASDEWTREVLDFGRLERLPGLHNRQNVAIAYAATRHLGLAPETIAGAIASFPGLAHRQELVATIDGIRYVNDSKATNADATEKALVCYDNIYWIAGGVPKAGGIASLAPHFPRIRHAFLIGHAAEDFAATLGTAVGHTLCGDLASAVEAARRSALAETRPGGTVLLSPACASFDQFANFEERGLRFRGLVEALPGRRS